MALRRAGRRCPHLHGSTLLASSCGAPHLCDPIFLARGYRKGTGSHESKQEPQGNYGSKREPQGNYGNKRQPQGNYERQEPQGNSNFRPGIHLVLTPADKDRIQSSLDYRKPKRLRTEVEVFQALRSHGYVPAIDRVEEMLDMHRNPHQSPHHFDKITLGLLQKTAKTVDGGNRNPYKIPHLTAGVNPVRTKAGTYPKHFPAIRWFLFPDNTNWSLLNDWFPLREPPRPWHPIVMMGLKQDYSKEEVARKLEWSMVQNAKKIRNGYGWAPPDPATYEQLTNLPPPPPPVIRTCNVCKKPRYLMRFWNFFYQRWQHVSSPHRPHDCGGHARGSCGRLMYAAKGTKIDGLKATKIENKDWIEEETAVKLLYRCGFIYLPTINQELGKIMSEVSRSPATYWDWIKGNDIRQWAMRGGRMNGLLDLAGVNGMADIEEAQALQQQQFEEEYKTTLEEVRQILEREPIAPGQAAALPEGYLYPDNHAATRAWFSFERDQYNNCHAREKKIERQRAHLKATIMRKLSEYDKILEEMRATKAEILLLERGKGEIWINPDFASLNSMSRTKLLQKTGEFDPSDPQHAPRTGSRQERRTEFTRPDRPSSFRTWEASKIVELTSGRRTQGAEGENGDTEGETPRGNFATWENASDLWKRWQDHLGGTGVDDTRTGVRPTPTRAEAEAEAASGESEGGTEAGFVKSEVADDDALVRQVLSRAGPKSGAEAASEDASEATKEPGFRRPRASPAFTPLPDLGRYERRYADFMKRYAPPGEAARRQPPSNAEEAKVSAMLKHLEEQEKDAAGSGQTLE